jgi:NADP-dependent 3-hydroxy acid dehydrogenase YdfG
MKNFKNKVAVITGAAGGIGLSIAKRCIKEGMKVVLSDIDEDLLKKVTAELINTGGDGDAISVVCDVAKLDDVKKLADQTLKAYGKVNLLVNNAGVIPGINILKNTIKDWKWVMEVNLWGVIYGVNTFLPIMLDQTEESHIINTSSFAGIVAGNGAYAVTKFGVTALSEMMKAQLTKINSKVNVSLLIPGIVDTGIVDSNRNRPKELKNPSKANRNWDEINKRLEVTRNIYRNSMSPDIVADMVFNAIENDIFYIFTEMGMKAGFEARNKAMLSGIDSLKEFFKKNNLDER